MGGLSVSRSACWSYVTWYNALSSGDWATWLPGEPVSPGDVGTFNKDRRFGHYDTLKDLGITCARYSAETPTEPHFYYSKEGLAFESKAAGCSAPGFVALGELDAGIRITAETAHACVLQMLDPTTKYIKNQRQVQDDVLARLRNGQWSIDWQIVMKRTRCPNGFAAISQASGQILELKAAGALPAIVSGQDLGGLELTLASTRVTTDFLIAIFNEISTPVFGALVRVKRGLWDKLLPWRSEGGYLIDPNGKRFHPRELPPDLSAYSPDDRRYDPGRSAMSAAELSSLTVENIFEEVTSLPDGEEFSNSDSPGGDSGLVALAAVRSFPLPRPVVPATLAAADEEDGASILLDFASGDGLAQFTLYDRGSGRYWLEVTLRHPNRQVSVVALGYRADDGTQRDLLIPVGGDNAITSSSVVNLRGYRPGTEWHAWPPVSPAGCTWSVEVVRRSVLASVGTDTVLAWERLAALVRAETRQVIEGELQVLRGTS